MWFSQDDDRVSLFDRSTWSGERLGGAAVNDDKPETFVAQARNLLDSLQVALLLHTHPA